MGRSPCCDKVGLKKGPWTPEEDQKLLAYIEEHGHGSWRALPSKAGLQRCGKSCRLRWTNYLRPDIKRGKFSLQEEQTIIQLHALLGNRWSAIATHLPKRTDNEIKNYWNTHLKKRLAKMGIDPVTHKPKNDALLSTADGQSKDAANLSHMAQWESARLEAEARLVRQSKLRSNNNTSSFQNTLQEFSNSPSSPLSKSPVVVPPRCLDILKAWNGVWTNPNESSTASAVAAVSVAGGLVGDVESPTSTLSSNGIGDHNSTAFFEFVGNNSSGSNCEGGGGIMKEEGEEDWKGFENSNHLGENSITFTTSSEIHDLTVPMDHVGDNVIAGSTFVERFTDLLLSTSGDRSFSEGCGESDNGGVTAGSGGDSTSEYLEDNKNYWNSILNLVNSSPSDSAMF
ncbi:hypothetical protein M9H77_15517 [Catharanthus roseus]|uniref:Uncharacterized protein n=1 Tax=Catharanthus roseus TaxID=4058 RepID=A0ACC0AXQ9_CATRO|nr:hypothetical protein M9H77_15517 [Catharanthus roseus]